MENREEAHSHDEVIAMMRLTKMAVDLVPGNHPCEFGKAVAGMIGLTIAVLNTPNGAVLFRELYNLTYRGFVSKHLAELRLAGLELTPAGAAELAMGEDTAPHDPQEWN